MASGPELPAIYGQAVGSNNTGGGNSIGLFAPAIQPGRRRIHALWLYSTTVTFGSTPAGWSKLLDQVIGNFRCGIFYNGQWDYNSDAETVISLSGSASWSANGNVWDGWCADASALAVAPVVASGGVVASMPIPALTLGSGVMPMWFWAVRAAASVTTRSIGLPADLVSVGNNVPNSGTSGIVTRAGAWVSGTGGAGARALQHPSGSTGIKTATTQTTNMTAWAGVGLALRAQDQGGQFAPAA